MPFARRRRAFRTRAARVPKAPKPPKMAKPPRPATKDLRMILRGLVTTDQGQRISSLLYALQWYDGAILFLTFLQKGQLTPEQRKSLDRVHKSRLLGQKTDFNGEKEQAYKTALRILEKLMEPVFHKLPISDAYYTILEKKKPVLEKKAENWMAKFGSTVDMMVAALQPTNAAGQSIQMTVGPIQDEVQKDPELRSFTLRPDIAKQLHRKRLREGLLAAVMEPLVIEELSRLSVMEKELDQNSTWTGKWVVLGGKQRDAALRMLRNLIEYAKKPEAPKRLVRMASAEPVDGQVKAPRAPRAFGTRPTGPLVDGMFFDGSTTALLWNILKDGEQHTKKDLRIQIGKKAINSSLKKMVSMLTSKGGKLEVSGNNVKLAQAPPAQPVQGGN